MGWSESGDGCTTAAPTDFFRVRILDRYVGIGYEPDYVERALAAEPGRDIVVFREEDIVAQELLQQGTVSAAEVTLGTAPSKKLKDVLEHYHRAFVVEYRAARVLSGVISERISAAAISAPRLDWTRHGERLVLRFTYAGFGFGPGMVSKPATLAEVTAEFASALAWATSDATRARFEAIRRTRERAPRKSGR